MLGTWPLFLVGTAGSADAVKRKTGFLYLYCHHVPVFNVSHHKQTMYHYVSSLLSRIALHFLKAPV